MNLHDVTLRLSRSNCIIQRTDPTMTLHHVMIVTAWCVAAILVLRGATTVATVVEVQVGSLPRTVTLPTSGSGQGGANLTFNVVHGKYNGKTLTGHLARINNPVNHWHTFCAGCSGFNTCSAKSTISDQAKDNNCVYATNGAPFYISHNGCLLPAISLGVLVANVSSRGAPCVAITRAGDWLLGDIPTSAYPSLADMQCGFNWLVFNGSLVATSPGGLIAPRTVLGVASDGSMLSFEVDGAEKVKWGTTMQQTAAWVQSLGMVYAINFDGGGSSATVYQDKVQGCPTCIDIPFLCCQRSVPTISCVQEAATPPPKATSVA